MPLRGWLALVAVAVGTFAMVTAEQLPMGLLTPIGGSLDVSEGPAGLLVTVPVLSPPPPRRCCPSSFGKPIGAPSWSPCWV
ncbi:hypothetical protein [Streptomyces violascens]|uniref:hypothetical protein n=1 Tax=Streptomyces violascens TaxID=67381 RepID=UPI0036BBDD38